MRTLKISLLIFILSVTISAQDFWQQTNGPYNGATVNDFLLYDDSIIFLATNEGIIKSTDGGSTWNRITGQYQNRMISCIENDNFGVLYAGTKDFYNNMLLLKSIDQGNSWTSVSGASSKDIVTILIPYKNTIFIGSSDMGIYRLLIMVSHGHKQIMELNTTT